jgi:hypothetical protein
MDPTVDVPIHVVTTFAPSHWDEHARKCVRSFIQHWPASARLLVFYESKKPKNAPRCTWIDIDRDRDHNSFIRRNRRKLNGLTNSPARGGHYKYDAIKFCHKVYAQKLAAEYVLEHTDPGNRGYLIWMDADTITHTDVDANELVSRLQALGGDVSCFQRPEMYASCTSFIAYNMNNEKTLDFIHRFADIYNRDAIKPFEMCCDGALFDRNIAETPESDDFNIVSLTGTGSDEQLALLTDSGDAFGSSFVSTWMRHFKGHLKRGPNYSPPKKVSRVVLGLM